MNFLISTMLLLFMTTERHSDFRADLAAIELDGQRNDFLTPKQIVQCCNRLLESGATVTPGVKARILERRGDAHVLLEKDKDAERDYLDAIALVENKAKLHVKLAKVFVLRNEIEKALKSLLAAEKQDPRFSSVNVIRTAILFHQGKSDNAIAELNMALKKNPNHAASLCL